MLSSFAKFQSKDFVGILTVFCYVFSFYIVGPLTSSIVIALPYIYMNRKEALKLDRFSSRIFLFLLVILFVSFMYSIMHLSFDYSYAKTMIAQTIHLFMGTFIVSIFRKKYNFTSEDIEKFIVIVFFIQSIIELIASVTPAFAAMLLPLNRAYEMAINEPGRRGLALASGTTWSLGLSFGLLYIIYVKRYLMNNISAFKIGIGVILLAGTMFAGRTGFVGAGFGVILFFLNANKSFFYKASIIIKILLLIAIICVLFYLLLPSLTTHLIENVFPFAFEPFYKLFYNDEFSTGSTDRLQEMWEVTITPLEALFGTGNFTNPSGSYYKHIDIGIMRNLFFWGIGGYAIMIAYQLYFFFFIKTTVKDRKERWNMASYRFCMIAYLFVMEFKAMVIGYNKMSMSIIFLLAYFYYHEYNEQKHRININNYSLL